MKKVGDPRVVIAAALLHDIGIHEAERKYGLTTGKYQEIEGPLIARRIMQDIDLEESTIKHVCLIVGSHHSGQVINTIEFRILWDTDWLISSHPKIADFEARKSKNGLI